MAALHAYEKNQENIMSNGGRKNYASWKRPCVIGTIPKDFKSFFIKDLLTFNDRTFKHHYMEIDLSLELVFNFVSGSTTNFSSYLIRHQRFRMMCFCWLILIDKNLRCGLCTPLLRQPDRIMLDEKNVLGLSGFLDQKFAGNDAKKYCV